MRKSTAFVAASAFGGLNAGLLVAATPAQAMPTETCTDVTDHVVTDSGQLDPDWYMDCVPQFGAGKAEFTITSDMDLPDEFNLMSADIEVTTSLDTDAAAAYSLPVTRGPFGGFFDREEVSANSARYTGKLVAPVAGVSSVPISQLPAACDADTENYAQAYRVDYEEVTTTFSREIDGVTWSVEVNSGAEPLFLAFTPDVDAGEVAEAAICAASDGHVLKKAHGDDGWKNEADERITFRTASLSGNFVSLARPGGEASSRSSLGTFEVVREVTPDPDPTPTPDPTNPDPGTGAGTDAGDGTSTVPAATDIDGTLPKTGSDVSVGGALAALAAMFTGAVLVMLGRRRPKRLRG